MTRHGQTEDNKTLRLAGQKGGRLTDLGRKQAELLGENIKNQYYECVYVSDLNRTIQTYNEIVRRNPSISEVHFERLIREKSGGLLEGQKLEVPRKMAMDQNIDIRDFKPEGGECWKDVYQRSVQFMDKLIASHL